jgi:hypothetical protein
MYFRGRMHCWWIFDFETDYMYIFSKSIFFYTEPLQLVIDNVFYHSVRIFFHLFI